MTDGEPVMEFFDADGNQVREGDPAAVVQYLSDDPNRPATKARTPGEDKARKAPAEDKVRKAPPEGKS